MLYLVENNYGRAGKAFVETDRDSNSRAEVIDNIRTGQYDDVICILEIDENAGRVRNVTDELLAEAFGEHDDSDAPAVDHQANRFDLKRDELKHMERV